MNINRIRKSLYCFCVLLFTLVTFFSAFNYVNAVAVGDVKNFTVLGGVESWSIPATGYYQLEVWGAQGGGSSRIGGYGAYATGAVFLRKDDRIFVVVGGTGGSRGAQGSYEGAWGTAGGGYNGGGGGYGGCGQGGGGGATHIATASGLLSSLSGKKDEILIVAGGGGGYYHWKNGAGAGNHGGGYAVTPAGNTAQNGWFGQGGTGRGSACGGGGGGGGFTGGGGGGNIGVGGGGSSYIANEKLLSYDTLTKAMYTTSGSLSSTPAYYTLRSLGASGTPTSKYSKAGGGYARITIMDLTNTNSKLQSLTLDKGSMVPSFDPDTTSYDVVVGSEDYRIKIDAIAQETTSTVAGDGYVDLPAGLTVVPITVTAESGDTTVYTLNVTRPMSSYEYLADIKIDGTSISGFQPEKITYDITVPYDMEELDIEAIYGRPSQTIYMPMNLDLDSGLNVRQIMVISEDGVNTVTYTLNITREHTSLLKGLVLGEYEFVFDPNTFEYDIDILGSTMSLPVIATPYDEEASVNLDGFGYIKTSKTAKITVTEPNSSPTVYTINIKKGETSIEKKYEYPYNGGMHTFTAPSLGYYKLEVWGAQGGSSGGRGGYGAYAVGTVYLHEGDSLYITIGGSGGVYGNQGGSESYWATSSGGYNGGGSGYSACGQGGGGGATHIATTPGLLYTLSNQTDQILIVAAGGGGGYHWHRGDGNGNSGGGYSTTPAGSQYRAGGFGYGGGGAGNKCGGGGGGSGYYGGGGGGNVGVGGGGSSYIGHPDLMSYKDVTKSMYGYYVPTSNEENTYTVSTNKASNSPISYYAKGGAGYAIITLLPEPSGNNFLSILNLKTQNGLKPYTPALDYEIEDYYVTLQADETVLNIAARPEDSTAKIEGLGDHDIPAGTTIIPIKVTAESGAEKTYKIHVTRPASSEKYPLDIIISGLVPSLCSVTGDDSFCKLNPQEFDKNTDTYYLTVPYRIKQLYFDVHKGHPYQNVVGEGKVSLNAGENTIVIEVQSEDGSGTSVYTYYVTRDMTGDTDIALAIIDPERDINFDPDISEYYITVDNSYDKYVAIDGNLGDNFGKEPSELVDLDLKELKDTVQLYIRTDDPDAVFSLVSPSSDGSATLKTGLNEIQIFVTAQTGDVQVYVLNIYRLKSENVFLSSLEVVKDATNYTLSPTFSKEKLGPYQVSVPNEIDEVLVKATPEVDTTNISGIGTKQLHVGTNKFDIITTAENGTVETYKLTISRAKNNNPNLSNITVKDDTNTYTLDPTFDKDTLTYNVEVPEGTNKINITATPEVATTKYKLLDNDVIKVGNNVKRVKAIAEDGTSKTYTINIHRPPSSNNYLSDLEVIWEDTEFTLTPEFDRDTLNYTLEVENEVAYLNVNATRENNLASIKGTGKYNLKVGKNLITVIVINESNEMRVYQIDVTRKPNTNAYLSEIVVGAGILSPEFKKDTLEYTLNVDNEIAKIEIKGVPEVSTTTVTGNQNYNLIVGENDIELVTLAEDGVTTLTYKIKIVRDRSTKNKLTNLVMEEGKLTPTFHPNIIEYTAKVPYEVTQGTFHVTLEDPNATYEIIGNENWQVGENEVIVRVTSEKDQGTEHHKDYKITVTRQEYEEASSYLASLTVNPGELSPDFVKTKQLYTVVVPYETTKIRVDATAEESTATVTGPGEYNLEIGNNLIVVTVTSKNGTTRDYQIEVMRQASSEARLSALILDGSLLSQPFNKDVYEYSTTTTNPYLSFVQISTVHPDAYFEIMGNDFYGGDGVLTITVTAPDGITQKVYTINVTKEPGNNTNLAWLEVENYQIVPEFSPQTTDYTLTVPNDVASVNIIAYPEDFTSTIYGDGIHIVNVGQSVYYVEVTSESGNKKVYSITVNKEGSNNNNIRDLQVLNGAMTPAFDGRDTYDVVVPYEETSLDLLVTLEDVNASYSVVGNDLKVGNNTVTVIVTAENGQTKNYTLNVVREEIISALLENILVKNYTLKPKFDSYINSYDILANYETEALDLTIIPLDKNATWVIKGNENFIIGDNLVEIEVTSSDGNSTETYYLNVRRQPYVNTFLDYLYTDQGDLTPTYQKRVMEYSIDVPYEADEIELIGEVVDKTNTVTGLGKHSLQTGENRLEVVVTALSGIKRTYIVNVNRDKNDDNFLASLTARVGGTVYPLKPDFSSGTLEYTVDVPIGTQSINLQGTLTSDSATVTGLGMHNLVVGENSIDIVVTSESGKTRTYTVKVNRPASNNNMLINLIPRAGKLEPSFQYLETEYTINLDSGVKYLSFDVVTEDVNATFTGYESLPVPDGVSTRKIVVTAEDGSTREYVITINKDRSDITRLANLEVTGFPFKDVNGDPLDFDPDVHNYYISVPNSKQILLESEVIAVPEDPNSKVTKAGNLTLITTDTNAYIVTVTAPDGFTKESYRILIERGKGWNALLNNLIVNKGYLTEKFNPNVFEYDWMVPKNITLTSADVTAILQDINAKVEKTASVKVSLTETNQFLVTVTSEDEVNHHTYTLNLIPDLAGDTTLGSLVIDKGYYEPNFDPNIKEYNSYQYEDTTSVLVTATPSEANAVVSSGNGLVLLDNDVVEHLITVTAENGAVDTYLVRFHKTIKRDEGLSNLYLNGLEDMDCNGDKCLLSPDFDTDTLDYKIKVPYEYTNLDILAETMNDQQSVKFKVNGNYITTYNLPLGKTTALVEVYDGMGVLTKTYTLEVERTKSSNNYLSSLIIKDLPHEGEEDNIYNLDPEFDKKVQEYSITVGADIDEVVIKATPDNPDAIVKVNGYNYLQDGNNDATITVTAPDGSQRTYIVHILKVPEHNSYLRNITVSSGTFAELSPKFKPTTYDYKTTISHIYDKVIVEAVPLDPGTTIVGTGEYELKTGSNIITLIATASDGSSVSTYTVNIVKTVNNNVDLASLIVEEGDLRPKFDKGTTKYDITVGEDVDQLTIHAIPYERTSTVTITGNENLHSGYNTVNVIVMNKDKTASKTYQLKVFKEASSNNRLTDLRVLKDDVVQPMNPNFNPGKFNYRVDVTHDTEKVYIEAESESVYANITGTGEESLVYGSNVRSVDVEAENGTVKSYVIDIYRNYNLDLNSIVTDVGTLDPVFDKDTLEYNINVDRDTTKISIIGFAESNKVNVQGNNTYNLNAGKNEILLRVVAPDGKSKTYKVNVNREADDNNYIESLVAHQGGLDPEFDKTIQDYTINVRKTTTKLDLDILLESDKAKYEVLGNENFKMGYNEVIVRVTAENGDVRDYTLNVVLREDDYFSNRLLDLSISEGKLNPDFDPDTYYYAANVPNSTSSLIISATKESDKSTVTGTGLVNLEVGRNVFPVRVTGKDGRFTIYTLVIYRSDNNDATLSSLSVKNYGITPIFNKQQENYKVTINKGETELDLTALPTDRNASVRIIGNENLQFGDNTISIIVTAPDGVTTKTYTLTVTKERATNNFLSSLVVNGYTLTPAFEKTNNGPYRVDVDANVNSIVIEATPEVASTVVSGDGAKALTNTSNVFEISATAESGDERIYTVIVNKKLNSDNTLKQLIVSDGALSPEFDPTRTDYIVNVPSELSEITVIGFANKDTSTVTGNGTYDLNDNPTVIPIVVTAEDGSTKTYTIKVQKEVENSSKIMDLIVKNGELQPHFHKNITSYTVAIPNEVTSLDMIVTLEDPNATYEIKGNENFRLGNNIVEVVVTATNGDKTTYEINAIRGAMASNYLSFLRVQGYEITPTFDKETLYYTLTVPNDVTEANIIASVEDPSSTVTGTGMVNLNVGRNDNYVTVTSSGGVIRTYTVAITRESEFSSRLRNLVVKNGELQPHFDKYVTDYKVSVPNEVTSLDMVVTLEDDKATYEVIGNQNFVVGKNNVQVIVTGQDGLKTTYNLEVTREIEANNYLTNIEVVGYTISPTFNKTTLDYTLTVPNNVDKVTISATLEDPNSTVTGVGEVTLDVGANPKYVTVTSDNGIIRTYTITITREQAANAKIMDLIVKNGELKPKFNKDVNEYGVIVPFEVTSLDMIVTLEDDNATYEVLGNQNFVIGNNKVQVVVTGASGNKNTYVINVTRGPEAQNYLTDLEVLNHTMTPNFDKETLYYTLTVPYSTDKVTIKATLEDPLSTVVGDGIKNLSVGRNDCYVTVTSSNGVVRTYTIAITRESEFSSKLRDLIVKNGELKPRFDADTLDYSVVVPNEVTSLDMIVTLEDSNATYEVIGNSNFNVGNNNYVKVVVTSKDGYKTTYKIKVTRGIDAQNYLTNLEVQNFTMNPTFDKETLYYTLTVPKETDSVNIIATLEDPASTVVGNGIKNLSYGRNDCYVTVTSSNGVIRTYTIAITRETENDNKLLTLVSDVGTFNPNFEPTINEYTLRIPTNVSEVNLTGTVSDGASVIGLGKVNVSSDTIDHNVIVTGATGDVNTYVIHIVKGNTTSTDLLKLIPSVGEMNYSNDITDYEFEVPENASTIYFDYELSDPTASITGVEVRPLDYGENNIQIVVTATNGDERIINVKVTRNKELIAIIPDEEGIVLVPEEEKTITYTFDPVDTTYTDVEFSIADEAIATVDETGKVTAHEFGSTILTITSKHNPLIFAQVTVDVLNTKITSSVLDVIRDVTGDACEFDSCPDIVIGEEPEVAIQDFLTKFDNDATLLHVYDREGNEIEDMTTFTGSFMTLKLIIRDKVYDEVTISIRGDGNGDGKIEESDVVFVVNYIYGLVPETYVYWKTLDVNKDLNVYESDVILVINYIYGLILSFN